MSEEEQFEASKSHNGSHELCLLNTGHTVRNVFVGIFEIDEQFTISVVLFHSVRIMIDKYQMREEIGLLFTYMVKVEIFRDRWRYLKVNAKEPLEKGTRTEIHSCIKYFRIRYEI